jgi:hypothetical protein
VLKKEPAAAKAEFELRHTFAKSVKSAIFGPVLTFFFWCGLSKMQYETFKQHYLNK